MRTALLMTALPITAAIFGGGDPPPSAQLLSALRRRFPQRQTRAQPSHTVTHPLWRSREHDFAVVMATAAHSYLTKLPRGQSGGNESKEGGRGWGGYFVCVFMCDYVLTAVMWVVLDNRGVI